MEAAELLLILTTARADLSFYAVAAVKAGAVSPERVVVVHCCHVRPANEAERAELSAAADEEATTVQPWPLKFVVLAVNLGVDLHE